MAQVAGADMGMHPSTAILAAASRGASLWCRSSIRRVLEVVVLVLVTSGIWFLMAYGSPCKELPSKVKPPPQRAPVLLCTPEGSCRGPRTAEAQHLSIWPAFRPAPWCPPAPPGSPSETSWCLAAHAVTAGKPAWQQSGLCICVKHHCGLLCNLTWAELDCRSPHLSMEAGVR